MSAKKRTEDELQSSVIEWIDKKYNLPRKKDLREALFKGKWSLELVVNIVRHPEELDQISKCGIGVHHLRDIVVELERDRFIIERAAGSDLVDLVNLDSPGNSA